LLAVGPERAALLINVRAEASRAAAPVHRSSTPFSALSCQELRRSWSPGLAGVGYVKRHVASAVAGPGPPRLSNAGEEYWLETDGEERKLGEGFII
jgi:hypothetical protein